MTDFLDPRSPNPHAEMEKERREFEPIENPHLFVTFTNGTSVERDLDPELEPPEQAEQVAREEGDTLRSWEIDEATECF